MNIWKEVNKVEDYAIEMRRYFHMNPELSWEEYNTARKIEEELDSMGIENKRVYKTGVIGTIYGKNRNVVLGIRADTDALPVQENTGLEYTSKNDGVMHACGHDAHTAILLATAKVLSNNLDKLPFTIKLIFQPAEEFIMDSGAKYMVELNDIKELDNIIGLHIWADLEAGKISVQEGPVMASADTFEIEVIGEGGHGAQPHKVIDPIITASNLVNNLQTLASRENSPIEPFVLSICSIQGGDSSNVIPNKVILKGTVRTFNNDLRDGVEAKMERIIKNTCETFRADYKFKYFPGTPATINESKSVKIARKSVKDILGEEGLVELEPTTGGEDFARYLQIIPGCYGFLGGKIEGYKYPHHNEKFDIDESTLKNGVSYFLSYILNYEQEINKK